MSEDKRRNLKLMTKKLLINTKKRGAVKLSVVVGSIYSVTILKKCLDSIFANKGENIEIIVAQIAPQMNQLLN
jgi:hypothetical protein